jgi:ADP-heptose:LPS heptosyltransferase
MANFLHELPHSAAVAIIRLRSLGDCVLTTPAIELLHQFRPDLRIGVVVEQRFAAVFEGNPAVRAILAPTVPAVRRWNADLCVNLHGGTRSLSLTISSGARFRAGFSHFRYAGVYNVPLPTAQEILGVDRKVHTAEHLASAMFHLGVPRQPIPRASLFADTQVPERPYAVIHPFAAAPEKTWPAEGFVRAATYLEQDCGLRTRFIAAPGEDLSAFAAHEILSGPLSRTKSVLAAASLFIGNDSGPAHMAAAFGVPVVVLFGPSDPVVWAPWKVESRALADPQDIRRIRPEDVIAAVGALQVTAQ